MKDEEYFRIGDRCQNRNGWYEVIEKGNGYIKIRYEWDGKTEIIKSDFDILRRVHENLRREITIWWVCHTDAFWEIDKRLIGFWRENQWKLLKVGDTIIYYSIGQNTIRGVFKIIDSGEDLNPDFRAETEQDAKYQCRLDLVAEVNPRIDPREMKQLSFYNSWSSQRWGGLKIQVFPAKKEDFSLILEKKEGIIPE